MSCTTIFYENNFKLEINSWQNKLCLFFLIPSDLHVTTISLDLRLTTLEENGNQTLTELEVKVETLEATAADHETRISAAEVDVDGRKYSLDLL